MGCEGKKTDIQTDSSSKGNILTDRFPLPYLFYLPYKSLRVLRYGNRGTD